METLKNRIAIITGGARGIGRITAETFLKAGAKVYIWDIASQGKEVARALGEHCFFQKVNTTKEEQIHMAAEEIMDEQGQIDILINNAGITRDASLKKMSVDDWQSVIDVNLTGVFLCTKYVSLKMAENNYGRICNASSIVGVYGNFGQSNYVATKAGLNGLTKTWAKELGRKGITVNSVAPGFIATEMLETVPQKVLDQFIGRTPLQRLGEAQDIANAYLFLSSDQAGFITGTVLQVDGGLTL